jgi:3-hydroxy-9,10-secoandrosta-1,3,5(10)-triene-9,17-dione monooxygenase reductase component
VTRAHEAGDGDLARSAAPTVGQARYREVLGHFATGVTVVTAMEDRVPVGFTCQAFASLSLDPPMVVLAPAKSSTSWPRMVAARAFCVNILAEHQEALARAFAVSGGDKFVGVGWRPGFAGTPVLDGALAWVECELGAVHDAGDHELVTGRVLDLGVGGGGGAGGGGGGGGAGPLVFYRGGFGRFSS